MHNCGVWKTKILNFLNKFKTKHVSLFEVEDKFALRKKADSNVIAVVANKILLDTNYEEAEKK